MFIRIGIRKKRNTDDSLGSGTKLLLSSLSFGFRHEERERERERETHTHDFSMLSVRPSSALNSLTQPTRVRTPQFITGLASPRSKNQLASSTFKSQFTALIPNHLEFQPVASGQDVIYIPSPVSYLGVLLGYL